MNKQIVKTALLTAVFVIGIQWVFSLAIGGALLAANSSNNQA